MRRGLLTVALLSSVWVVTPVQAQSDQPAADVVREADRLAAKMEAEAVASSDTSIVYPPTKRVDLVETQFGVKVADPYRWLESDVRSDADVRAWVDQQNAVTNAFL